MSIDRHELFVGGALAPAHSRARIALTNPAAEEPLGSVPDGDESDVDRAVAAARAAFPEWRSTPPGQRALFLRALADAYERRQEEIASLVTSENGSVISRSRWSSGARPVAVYRKSAALAEAFEEETLIEAASSRSLVRREPIGVVGAIVPWNAPQSLLARKLALSLVAGCPVVVKPSPETSLDAYLLAEAVVEAGLPPGVVNIVTGGRETGAALVRHPGVDKISFTGSTAAGRAIAATCGELLKPVTAELGGKSAAIVADDADLALFASSLISTCLPNSGQVCYASTRVLAPRSRFHEVVEVVVETLRRARVGNPMDPNTDFGPLVSAAQRDRVEGYIRSGLAEGARLALGGGRPPELPAGYYVQPTVFVDVTNTMRIFREEIFGPVLVVVPYLDEDDAVRVANDSNYGLGGSVFSADAQRATQIARRLETGSVTINGQRRVDDVLPFGYKDSGVGGDPGLSAYQQVKVISS